MEICPGRARVAGLVTQLNSIRSMRARLRNT
jgi:hypothetical protein